MPEATEESALEAKLKRVLRVSPAGAAGGGGDLTSPGPLPAGPPRHVPRENADLVSGTWSKPQVF